MFPSSLKKRKSSNNRIESEVETLQNALQEAMLRERQLIQGKAIMEDEMKEQRNASKQCIEVLMAEKSESVNKQLQTEAQQSKEDLQRVLQKLSQREHEHNQFNEEINKLRRSLSECRDKEKESNNTAQLKLLQSTVAQLKDIRQKNKIIAQEKENLKDALEHKEHIINELQNVTVSQLKSDLNHYRHENECIQSKLDELTQKGKVQIDELLAQNDALQSRITQLTAENETNLAQHSNEMTAMTALCTDYERKMSALNCEMKEVCEAKEAQMREICEAKSEVEIESKINSKKQSSLIRELQEQYKREVIKSQELKCQILKLNDETSRHTHTAPTPTPTFVEKEVSGALAKKLEIEVKSNFALKEQIKYLTESIQQLHIDLDNKKTVIQNLTKRIDIGALPVCPNNHHKTTDNTIQQLQLLMQETTLQNDMLRKDLKIMGKELSKYYLKNQNK